MKQSIKSGTICFLSEIGHNNFYYPSEIRTKIRSDSAIERLPWIGSNDLRAIKILSSNVNGVSTSAKYIAVWVDKSIIK